VNEKSSTDGPASLKKRVNETTMPKLCCVLLLLSSNTSWKLSVYCLVASCSVLQLSSFAALAALQEQEEELTQILRSHQDSSTINTNPTPRKLKAIRPKLY
jgi:exosome complex RNA-binding protein Rrp42 (RNase PH superfamily)